MKPSERLWKAFEERLEKKADLATPRDVVIVVGKALDELEAERPPAKDAGARIESALDIIASYGQIDGAHHKAWVIDQVARVLTGPGYEAFVAECTGGEDGPDTYEWTEGIAP